MVVMSGSWSKTGVWWAVCFFIILCLSVGVGAQDAGSGSGAVLSGISPQVSAPAPTPPTAGADGVKAPPPRYSVSGTVVNSVTGESVAHALVVVTAAHATFTDQNGQFTLEGLPAQVYSVQVAKPGFQSPFSGAEPETMLVGPGTPAVTFHLQPEGVITGQVVDEDGEGVPRIKVTAHW